MRQKMEILVTHVKFQTFIMCVIILNAITLGLETVSALGAENLYYLHVFDKVALSIFVIELCMKLFVYGIDFFKRPWCVFDFVVVGVSLVPASGNLSVIRSLRVLRVLRLISAMPSLRVIVSTFLDSIPGIGAVAMLFSIIFYVFAVMSVQMFGSEFPHYFENIGTSMFTLFQLMTLEGWVEVVNEIMVVYPWAGIFFILYILVSTFVLLNMVIAVVVNVMSDEGIDPYTEKLDAIMKELQVVKAALEKAKK